MREQDTFEPEDDPYDETASEEDLPDETDADRSICLDCGNILQLMQGTWTSWFCAECDEEKVIE